MTDFCTLRPVKSTRKPHACDYCGAEIPEGSAAEAEFGVFCGDPFSRYRCEACAPYVGAFWDDMDSECCDVMSDFEMWVEEHKVPHSTLTVEVPCRTCGKPVRMMKWLYKEAGFAMCPECDEREEG